jgi:hypothetical protein
MATPAITDEQRAAILADWKTGDFTQRHLSQKHKLALGTINKITKGTDKTNEHIVNKLVEAKQALSDLDELSAKAVNDVVDAKVKWLDYLNRSAIRNVKESMEMPCLDQADFKNRAQTIGITKEVLVGKSPDVSVQVNNQVNSLTLTQHEELSRKLINEI